MKTHKKQAKKKGLRVKSQVKAGTVPNIGDLGAGDAEFGGILLNHNQTLLRERK